MIDFEFEPPIATQIYDLLVSYEFDHVLELVTQNRDQFRSTDLYTFKWSSIEPSSQWPRGRSGHQMVAFGEKIYLFGGWTGKEDLADFWCFDIKDQKWTCISENTQNQGGPTPRSCFKMVIDSADGVIYFLGHYVDRRSLATVADFYAYVIRTNSWTKISNDTEADGGPPLVYDHQVCFDAKLKLLFCFGGRVVRSTSDVPLEELRRRGLRVKKYAGLYKWSALTSSWTAMSCLPDSQSRQGHGMVINDQLAKLYILGGTRSKVEMNDFIEIDYITENVKTLHSGFGADAPPLGITQRLSFDSTTNQIRLLVSSPYLRDAAQKCKKYSQLSLLDGAKITIIVVCSRNMA